MTLLGHGTPPTGTTQDGPRHWGAKVLYPARDTPRWACLVLAACICWATVNVFADAYQEQSWLRLSFAVLVLGLNAVAYVARVAVAVRRS